jgi:hypothetical protein
MSTDLSMLAWTGGLTALLWIPYILARIAKYGVMEALTYRADSQPVAAWADRAKKGDGGGGGDLFRVPAGALSGLCGEHPVHADAGVHRRLAVAGLHLLPDRHLTAAPARRTKCWQSNYGTL